jgi:hypothetical protein
MTWQFIPFLIDLCHRPERRLGASCHTFQKAIQINRPVAARRLRLLAAALPAVTVYKFLAITVTGVLEAAPAPTRPRDHRTSTGAR